MEPLRENRRSRRALLATVTAGVGASVAGCLGESATAPSSEETIEDATEDSAFPEHPIDEPREPPDGRRCDGPCGMEPAKYPDSNAQIAHEGGDGVFFDSVGCFVSYYQDPTFYDGPDAQIADGWVRDFGTKELLDATKAVFVLDYDKERHEEVMAHNPKPFADRADAIAYVESYDDLVEDDIISLDEFGAEQAHRYRDYPVPDDR
jgi:nitrous oxide reductase accessory protein NosL